MSVEGNRIKLPKLGWVKFRKSRDLIGKAKSATVSRNGKHWYVSILCELEVAEPIHPSSSAVGIDRGVSIMAACSDGKTYIGAKAYRKHEKRLTKAQRILARRVKFSNNWHKQKEKVQNIHSKIGNIRKDALHKASTEISKNHAMIVLEKLGTSRMSKSAKGNSDKHGTNVKAKSGLNKSILDAGWTMFAAMLEYNKLGAAAVSNMCLRHIHHNGAVGVNTLPRQTDFLNPSLNVRYAAIKPMQTSMQQRIYLRQDMPC
ncbi:MAG: transposase [Ghiorsea sp.]|nr:transposase [Ghiorsea sp.]